MSLMHWLIVWPGWTSPLLTVPIIFPRVLLMHCAHMFIPKRKCNFYKFWWSQKIHIMNEKAVESSRMWQSLECGNPICYIAGSQRPHCCCCLLRIRLRMLTAGTSGHFLTGKQSPAQPLYLAVCLMLIGIFPQLPLGQLSLASLGGRLIEYQYEVGGLVGGNVS